MKKPDRQVSYSDPLVVDSIVYTDKLNAEHTINTMRLVFVIFTGLVILFYIFIHNGSNITTSEYFDIIAFSLSLVHFITIHILLRKNKYSRRLTFISSFIDVTAIMTSVYGIQFSAEHLNAGAISQSFLILTIFYLIILTLRRHDAWNTFFTGMLSCLFYSAFIIIMATQKAIHFSFYTENVPLYQADLFFELCKTVLFIIAGWAGFIISRRYQYLFWHMLDIEIQARETTKRYTEVFSKHQLGTFSADYYTGKLIEADELARNILKINQQQNVNKYTVWEFFLNSDFTKNAVKMLEENSFFYFKRQKLVLDNSVVWIEGSFTAEKGKSIISGIIVDISENVEKEQQVETLSEKLITDQPLTEIGMNISGMLHNIKGYLHSVSQSISLLEDENTDTREEIIFPISVIKQNAEILIEMVENQNATVKNKPVDKETALNLKELAKTAINTLQTDPEVKTKIKFDVRASKVSFRANKSDILAIIYNLLKNARDAVMANDRQDKEITINIIHDESYVQIHVQDNGIGIPHCKADNCKNTSCMHCRHQVFGKSSKSSGSGLGLWSIKQYLIRNNGNIRFISDPDKGTSAIVQLPYND